MMIGGGGRGCKRADHGIGITEMDAAKFGGHRPNHIFDFGGDAAILTQTTNYALNLWIR